MQQELLINASMPETVKQYARNAKAAGLAGVVCSPLEAALVKEACGPDFLTVTPGIRFADGDVGDQVRVMTPAQRPGRRQRLHCCRSPHHCRPRPRRRLPPLRKGVYGRVRGTPGEAASLREAPPPDPLPKK